MILIKRLKPLLKNMDIKKINKEYKTSFLYYNYKR